MNRTKPTSHNNIRSKCILSYLHYFVKKASTIVPSRDTTTATPISPGESGKSMTLSDRLFYNKIAQSKTSSIFKSAAESAAAAATDTEKSSSIISSKYPLFYEKNVVITPEDHENIKYSWKLVVDEDLSYFNDLKKCGMISPDKPAVSWFYDMFYESVYSYDVSNNSNMTEIFKNNMKIQAHALIVIIKNCIHIAQSYSVGKKVNFDTMYKAHRDIRMSYSHYVIVSEILLNTFERCLCDQWTRDMEIAWCKTISVLLQAAAATIKSK